MGKEFTSVDVAAVVHELHVAVMNSRVKNFYQLDPKTIILKLRTSGGAVQWLLMEAGKRLHLTSYAREKPKAPPAFCMALRKHLRNYLITDVIQSGFERVVTFTFRSATDVKRIVLEVFGKGNIVLIDKNRKVLQALTYKRMRDRDLLRGKDFNYPPQKGKDPLQVQLEELTGDLRSSGDLEIVKSLARILSIGGFYAEEILLRVRLDKRTPSSELEESVISAVFNELHLLLSTITKGKLDPHIVLDEAGRLIDALPIRLKRYEQAETRDYQSFNEALDEFYIQTNTIDKIAHAATRITADLKSESEHLKRILESQKKALSEERVKEEKNRRIGDLIYAHSGELQQLLGRFRVRRKGRNAYSKVVSQLESEREALVKPGVIFESFDACSRAVNVRIQDLSFGLALDKSIFDNAARFYEQAKRARRRVKGAERAIGEKQRMLTEVDTKAREAELSESLEPSVVLKQLAERRIKPKKWFEKFRWFTSSEGFLVVGGKDAVSNEVLIKKHTEDQDVVFHADIVGAPFVVIKSQGREPTDQCLREAADFSGAFSRAWREGFRSVDVYWVRPDQLSKSGSGEHVPRGTFIIRGGKNWMRGIVLKVAVGVIASHSEVELIGGPVDAIKAKTRSYETIIPGDVKGRSLFEQILKSLASRAPKELAQKIQKLQAEDMGSLVPYRKGRLNR